MKKTAFILFAALFIFALQAQAQTQLKGGIRAGLNMATWGGDAVASFGDLMETTGAFEMEMKPDFHLGAYLQVPLSQTFSLEPGIYYSGKGTRVTQTFFSNDFIKPRVTLTDNAHYIEMPVLLRANLTPGLQLFAGPQVAYLVENRVKAEAGIFGASYEYDFKANPGLRKFDFGLTGGVGFEFANGINLQAGYDWGLSTLDEGNSNVQAFNRVAKVSLGYTFGKGK